MWQHANFRDFRDRWHRQLSNILEAHPRKWDTFEKFRVFVEQNAEEMAEEYMRVTFPLSPGLSDRGMAEIDAAVVFPPPAFMRSSILARIESPEMDHVQASIAALGEAFGGGVEKLLKWLDSESKWPSPAGSTTSFSNELPHWPEAHLQKATGKTRDQWRALVEHFSKFGLARVDRRAPPTKAASTTGPYFLELSFDSGRVTRNPYSKRRLALQFAGHALVDNGLATEREARALTDRLEDGVPMTHKTLTVTIEPAPKGTPTKL